MGQNALVTLDDKLLDVSGIVGALQDPLAEAAKSSKLPDLVLPPTDPELLIKLFSVSDTR